MRYAKILALWIGMIVLGLNVQAQTDTIVSTSRVSKSDSAKIANHTPIKAMCFSIIPGGGQIYNRKAWKVPIIYAGLAGCGYFIYTYARDMVSYRNEYINRRDGNTELLLESLSSVNTENLITLKNNAMRNMQIAIAATALVYALNIVDAMVDAHLYYFDVSDDLSLHWSPSLVPSLATSRPTMGLTLQFCF